MSQKFVCRIMQIGLVLMISCSLTAAQKTRRKKTPKKTEQTSPKVFTVLSVMDAKPKIKPMPLSERELTDSYIFSTYKSYLFIRLITDTDPIASRVARNLAESEIVRLTKLINENSTFTALSYLMRGEEYLKLGRYDAAIADFTEAFKLSQYESLNYRAIAYARKGDYETAVAEFTNTLDFIAEKSGADELLKYYLQTDAVTYNRGLARFIKGDYEAAISDLTIYLKTNPKQMKAFQLRAKAFRKLGKVAEVEADARMIEELQTAD